MRHALLAHGCPLQAIAVMSELDERAVQDGHPRTEQHGACVHEHRVQRLCALGQVDRQSHDPTKSRKASIVKPSDEFIRCAGVQ